MGKIACLVAAAVFAVACGKKSAEDHEKDWNKTVEDAQKYASKYPGAKGVLEDLQKSAKADFDEAKKAAEDQKAGKMEVAVDKLAKPLEVFKKYEDETGKLDALLKDKDIMNSMSAGDYKPLETAAIAAKKKGCCVVNPSDKACSDLQGTCDTVKIANMGDLKAKLEGAIGDMQAAEKPLADKKPKPAAPAGSGSGSGSAKK